MWAVGAAGVGRTLEPVEHSFSWQKTARGQWGPEGSVGGGGGCPRAIFKDPFHRANQCS